jgi:hypothetical protein
LIVGTALPSTHPKGPVQKVPTIAQRLFRMLVDRDDDCLDIVVNRQRFSCDFLAFDEAVALGLAPVV